MMKGPRVTQGTKPQEKGTRPRVKGKEIGSGKRSQYEALGREQRM
jgi:hypothetical protein